MYRLNEAEQREVYKRLVSQPAAEIRELVFEQLKQIDEISDISTDPRRGILQSYIEGGDKLDQSAAEQDRAERRKQYALAFMLGNAILEDRNSELIDPAMFYRGSSAIGRYHAAAQRAVVAMTLSLRHMPDESMQFFLKFVKPSNIWILALILIGVSAGAFWGGWVAVVISGILWAVGVYDLVKRADEVIDSLKSFVSMVLDATDDRDLDQASRYFAKAATLTLLTIIELWFLSKLFRIVENGFASRLKPPTRLQRAFAERSSAERARRKAESDRRKSDESKTDERKTDDKKTDDKKTDEGTRNTDESGRPIEAIGGKRLADELSDGDGLGWLALIGVGIGAAYFVGRRR